MRISDKALKRFKDEVRSRTSRVKRVAARVMLAELDTYTRGWAGYYARSLDSGDQMKSLDGWIRRRIRQWLWVSWKTRANRKRQLLKGGIPSSVADAMVWTRSAWKLAGSRNFSRLIRNEHIQRGGLHPLMAHWRRFASS